MLEQLLVDVDLFGDPQAVGHLDDVDPVEEGLVVAIVAERLPLALVGVGQHDAIEGNRAHALGGVVVAFLSGSQQRVQHLDRCLEHLDELHQALVGSTQATGETVGVRIILGVELKLADVHLTHQRRDILVVLVTRLGLGDGDLIEPRGIQPHHPELGDVTTGLLESLGGPGRHHTAQVATGNAVLLLEQLTVFFRREQAKRRLVHRRPLDGIERHLFHQQLEPLGQRRLAATHRPQQVENLLLLLEALGGVAEVGHDLLDGLLHAMEFTERRVAAYHLVGKDPRQPRVLGGVDHLGFTDGLQHALWRTGVDGRVLTAEFQIFLQGHFFLLDASEAVLHMVEDAHRCLL